jgi:hypothetical protein
MADTPCPTKTLYVFRPVIGILYLVGAFAVFILVLTGRTDIQWKDVALMITGALIAKSGTIVDWAFGSSQGSEKKTEMMADTAKAVVINTAETARVLAANEVAEDIKK